MIYLVTELEYLLVIDDVSENFFRVRSRSSLQYNKEKREREDTGPMSAKTSQKRRTRGLLVVSEGNTEKNMFGLFVVTTCH